MPVNLNNGLLDLEEYDGDLLAPHVPQAHARHHHGEEQADPPKICVVVRKRPLNRKEKERGDEDVVEVHMGRACVVVNETKLKVDLTKYLEKHQFNFDESLDESVSNEQVYATTVKPLVRTLFRNGKASCFAYGQTGSGKTYTMGPLPVRAAADIFTYCTRPENAAVSLHVSCFELYGNKVFDLLNARKRLNILEDGKKKVVVVGLKEFVVPNVEVLKSLIEESGKQRSTGSTAANADSSRSHSIMQFALKRPSKVAGEEPQLVGKMSFIDLAGSERGADTFDNNRQTRLEGAEINKSLLALKECIRALDSDARHVPFRGSKLTAVLRDSFVGDQARTVMIANISPNSTSVEHTLNTLRYADRVKELRKDKVDRAPGGVTPGHENWNAAVVRAGVPPNLMEAALAEREREYQAAVANSAYVSGRPLHHHETSEEDGESGDRARHGELMDSILMEEEELVSFHRARLEEDMELLRQEMSFLADVDMPCSDIDIYIGNMSQMLEIKLQRVLDLKNKVDTFKQKLKEEEQLQKTVTMTRADLRM